VQHLHRGRQRDDLLMVGRLIQLAGQDSQGRPQAFAAAVQQQVDGAGKGREDIAGRLHFQIDPLHVVGHQRQRVRMATQSPCAPLVN